MDLGPSEFHGYMRQFGPVDHWRLVVHQGKSKGYGFATFRHQRDADRARTARHELRGKIMECNYVFVGQSARDYREEVRQRKVFVSRLPFSADESEVAAVFGQFGQVERATVNRDHRTDRSRGSGFVLFTNHTAAQKAIKTGRVIFPGKNYALISECYFEDELGDHPHRPRPPSEPRQSLSQSPSEDCRQPTLPNPQTPLSSPPFVQSQLFLRDPHGYLLISHLAQGKVALEALGFEDENLRLNVRLPGGRVPGEGSASGPGSLVRVRAPTTPTGSSPSRLTPLSSIPRV